MNLFRRQAAPVAPPVVASSCGTGARPVAEPSRDYPMFIVVAYFDGRKVTFSRTWREVGETVTGALISGAYRVEAEKEWEFHPAKGAVA